MPSERDIRAFEIGSKSQQIFDIYSITPFTKYLGKQELCCQLFRRRCAFSKAGVDRENRLFVTVPQVYILSCLHDKAVCTLLPFLSGLCPGWKRAAQVCFSFPDYLKERENRKVVFVVGLKLFSLTSLLFLMLWSLFPCLFVLPWHLSFVQSAALLPGAGTLPASFSLPLSKSLLTVGLRLSKSFPGCLMYFQKWYNKYICKYN